MRYASSSSREAVLAQVGQHFVMAQEVAERVGVNPQTAIGHLWAAEAEGLVEVVEMSTVNGALAYFWRRNGR